MRKLWKKPRSRSKIQFDNQKRNKYQTIKTKTLSNYTFDISGAERANKYINNVNYIINYKLEMNH
jgi:hypothetical protein